MIPQVLPCRNPLGRASRASIRCLGLGPWGLAELSLKKLLGSVLLWVNYPRRVDIGGQWFVNGAAVRGESPGPLIRGLQNWHVAHGISPHTTSLGDVFYFNLEISRPYSSPTFLYTMLTTWLRCLMYVLPASILHPAVTCWIVWGASLHSLHLRII